MLLEAAANPAPAPEAASRRSWHSAKIVINLLYREKAGEPLNRERMRELIESTDPGKLASRGRIVRRTHAGTAIAARNKHTADYVEMSRRELSVVPSVLLGREQGK